MSSSRRAACGGEQEHDSRGDAASAEAFGVSHVCVHNEAVVITPLTHVPVAAGPAFIERIQLLPSKFSATLRAEPENRFNLAAVAVLAAGEKIGYLPPEISHHYFASLKDGPGIECPGRRAPASAHESTGTEILLDLTGVPCAT